MSNDINIPPVKINDKMYLVKNELKSFIDNSCDGCAFNQHPDCSKKGIRVEVPLLNHLNLHKVNIKRGETGLGCGLMEHILIEDTPKSIIQYLDFKLNGFYKTENDNE